MGTTEQDPPPRCAGYCHGMNLAKPAHTCPFKEEINENYETTCICYDACQHECAMDI